MEIQVDHSMCRNSSSGSSLLVAAWFNYHCISIVITFVVVNSSFFGRILGTSKTDLTLLGHLVSLFAEVSGDPYGTGIDLRMKGSWIEV